MDVDPSNVVPHTFISFLARFFNGEKINSYFVCHLIHLYYDIFLKQKSYKLHKRSSSLRKPSKVILKLPLISVSQPGCREIVSGVPPKFHFHKPILSSRGPTKY